MGEIRRKSNEEFSKVEITLALGVVLVIVLAFCTPLFTRNPREVTKKSTIEWLESTNPEVYKSLKSDLKDYLQEKLELEEPITDLAFKVYAKDIFSSYDVSIWYKCEDTWYYINVGDSYIKDSNIRKQLFDVVIG